MPASTRYAMLRGWQFLLVAINISLVIVIGVLLYRSDILRPAPPPESSLQLLISLFRTTPAPAATPSPLEYKDFVAILLSALSAMVAILGLLLAAAAIWGYQELKGAALRAAVEEVQKTVPAIATRAAVEEVEKTVPSIAARTAERITRQQVGADKYYDAESSDYGAAAGGSDATTNNVTPPPS